MTGLRANPESILPVVVMVPGGASKSVLPTWTMILPNWVNPDSWGILRCSVAHRGMTTVIAAHNCNESTSPQAATFKTNRHRHAALISRMRAWNNGRARHPPPPRIVSTSAGNCCRVSVMALVLDPGSAFLELSTWRVTCFDVPDADKSIPGGGLIAGIGFVPASAAWSSANDSGIDAGALQPYGLDKRCGCRNWRSRTSCLMCSCRKRRANLLRYRVEDLSGRQHLSQSGAAAAAGLPVVTVTMGPRRAGGAYQTGLSITSSWYAAGPAPFLQGRRV